MKEILIKDKEQYLRDHYPFENPPNLTEKRRCIHCDQVFIVGDYKVFREDGEDFIYCPNAPECDGTIIDWFPVYE